MNMRCLLIACCAVTHIVTAVRVDEDPAPTEAPAEEPEELTDEERATVVRAQAVHGAAEITAHKKADIHQAAVAAAHHVHSTVTLADEAKDAALKRAARRAIKLDRVAGEQEDATQKATQMTMRRDRLLHRSESTAAYDKKAEVHNERMIEDVKEKKEMEELEMESAVGAAHKEKLAEDAWVAADEGAGAAVKAKEEAERKYEADKEIAEKAEEDSYRADREAAKKAAAAHALSLRSQDKTRAWEEADKKKKEAFHAQKLANREELRTGDKADTSEAAAAKATADREVAAKKDEEAAEEEKVAKHKCKFSSSVAGQTLDDASASVQVHAEQVKVANQAAKEAAKARVQLGFHNAAEMAASAAVVAAKALNLANATVDAGDQALPQP